MIIIAPAAFGAVTEKAIGSHAFVDSVGINIHLHYDGSAYYTNFPAIKRLLIDAHIRHVRDGMIDTTWQPYYDRLNQLGLVGIHSTLVTNVKDSLATITAYPKRVSSSLEAIENPNEYDLSGDPHWATTLQSFTRALYSSVKTNPVTAHYTVVGPSLTSASAYQAVGDLSGSIDRGNIHDYFSAHNPGTGGYGDAGFGSRYGSIDYNRNAAQQASGSRPIVSTETGYGTASAGNTSVSEAVQAKYIPRLLLEHFTHGIQRTFLYQLVDHGTDGYGSFGIVREDLSAKPAFHAVSTMLALLDAPGTDRTDTLSYEISNTPNVAHVLFQKPDGTFALAYWLEMPSWNGDAPRGRAPIAVPSQPVTFRFTRPVEGVVTYAPTARGFLQRAQHAGGTAVSVSASDAVAFVSFRIASRRRSAPSAIHLPR